MQQKNVSFGSVLKNPEAGSCQCFCAHKNNIFLERSNLLAMKVYLVKTKTMVKNTDVFEASTKQHAITRWKLYKPKIVTAFTDLSEKFPS